MKKLIAIATSVTMFAGQILGPIATSAMRVDDEGGEYWYIPESIIHDKEVEAEIAEICAGSRNYNYCLNVARGQRINSEGNRYQAAYQLRRSRFLITAVNPYRSTIRVYYAGENSASNAEKANLNELYLYWIEDGKVTPELNWELYNVYFNQIRNSEPEDGIHVIYNETRDGEDPWIETEEEARLVLPVGSLTNNMSGQIFYTVVNDFGDVYSGFYRYQNSCIDNEYFGIGQECLGAYYIKNNAFTYMLSPYDEIEEDRELEISPLVAEPEVAIENPEDPEDLTEPTDPEDPVNPEDPENHDEPEQPEELGGPTQPEKPEEPEGPEAYNEPEAPEDLTIPEEPTNPEPEDTEPMLLSDEPVEKPNGLIGSDEPEQPEELEELEKSANTEKLEKPADTKNREETEEPVGSESELAVLEPKEEPLAEELTHPDEPKENDKSKEEPIKIKISGADDNVYSVGFGGGNIIVDDITTIKTTPKTPDTGESSNDNSEANWCLPLVVFLGVVYAIWWIVPVSRKKRQ